MAEIKRNYDGMNKDEFKIFTDMLSYTSPDILRVEIEDRDICFYCADGKEEGVKKAVENLQELIGSEEGARLGSLENKPIQSFNENGCENDGFVFDELISSGSIIRIQDGVYMYSGLFRDVMEYFKRKIREFADENFSGMVHYEVPVLFPLEEYEKGMYFETFPHHIMFQSSLRKDLENIINFSESEDKCREVQRAVGKPENVLRHAGCVPIYRILEKSMLKKGDSLNFGINAKCFRNEGENVFELSRLKEFHMMEYVFVGDDKYVRDSIEKSKELWEYWLELFGMEGRIELANDSFFANSYKKLRLFQLLGSSKFEMKWRLGSRDEYISVSSSNFHRTHFSKEYEIMMGEESYAQTGCFAFGIERLAYAFLCQKGLDTEKWSSRIREEIFG